MAAKGIQPLAPTLAPLGPVPPPPAPLCPYAAHASPPGQHHDDPAAVVDGGCDVGDDGCARLEVALVQTEREAPVLLQDLQHVPLHPDQVPVAATDAHAPSSGLCCSDVWAESSL